MAQARTPVLYIMDFNVGNSSDDPDDPFGSGRVAVGTPSGGELKTLIDHERKPDGVAVLEEGGGHLVWTQMGHIGENDGRIQSCDLDGKNTRDLFKDGEIHTPKQICIDETSHKIYVCDREGMRVHRSNLDGTQKEVLVQRGDWRDSQEVQDQTRHCVGIAVDAKGGKFYWTQKGPSKGGKGRIFRANIEMPEGQTAGGRDDIELLFTNLPEPIDLHLDGKTQTLYWTDRGDFPKGNTLNKADMASLGNGKQDYKIIARHLHEAIGVALDDQNKHIYVSDLGGCAYQYDMDGGNCKKLFEGQGAYTGIALAHLEPREAQRLYRL